MHNSYREILLWENKIASSFDIYNIGEISDDEIIELIEKQLGLSLSDDRSYEKINRLFQKTISYLKDELFYTDTEIGRAWKNTFKTQEDVIWFFRNTKKSKWLINCVILKLIQAINDSYSEFNERVRIVKEKTSNVIDNKLIRGLVIEDTGNEDYMEWKAFIEINPWIASPIPFKLIKRLKSDISSASKEIRKPQYHTIDRTSDLYGATFKVKNKDDILPLLEYVAWLIFKRWEFVIKNDTNLFWEDDICVLNTIRDDTKEKIIDGTKKRDEEWSWTIQNIKISSPYYKDDSINNLNLEIKFELDEGSNENGTNMHGVYSYMKKILERIRLEGYVSLGYLEVVATKFMTNIEDIMKKSIWRENKDIWEYKKELFRDLKEQGCMRVKWDLRNKHVSANIDKYIINGLVEYFKMKLIPIHRNNGKKILYTNKRALKLSKKGIGPIMKELTL